ncbi:MULTISPECIES: phage tail protein [unclassified Azospirillum]|jgi:microcystin-dependent protein|uniref:phage tail protein n=1 Tax=unclassified Azospirillum TaxID=2630922 RepID=UPI000B632F6F|nr:MULTISPECIES: tail fiber protein [unclassified Azospirillum]SNT18124.1 Microcystin-dependent protein [Azospirillum sp. RU38E]SNT30159.1 Microcystin-dependent protein [Azospirillum sp. RU37A]
MEYMMGSIVPWAGNFIPRGFMNCQGQTLAIQQYNALFAIMGTIYGGNGSSTFMLPDLRGRTIVGVNTSNGALPVLQLGHTAGSPVVSGVINSQGAFTLGISNLPQHTHSAIFKPTTGNQMVTMGQGASTLSASVAIPVVDNATASTTTQQPNAAMALANAFTKNGPTTYNTQVYSTAATTTTLKPFPAAVSGSVGALTGSITTVTGGTIEVGATGAGQAVVVSSAGAYSINVTQPSLGLTYLIVVDGIFPSRD